MHRRLARPRLLFFASVLIAACGLLAAGCGSDDNESSTAAESPAARSDTEAVATTAGTTDAVDTKPGDAAPRSEKVEIVDFAFDPETVTIQTGGKITWSNQDSAPHDATAEDGGFATEIIEEGKIASETFKEAGTYSYICSIHPTMHGTIEVVDPE